MIVSPLYEGWSLWFYLVIGLLSCQLIRLAASWRSAATARPVLFLPPLLRQHGRAREPATASRTSLPVTVYRTRHPGRTRDDTTATTEVWRLWVDVVERRDYPVDPARAPRISDLLAISPGPRQRNVTASAPASKERASQRGGVWPRTGPIWSGRKDVNESDNQSPFSGASNGHRARR